MTIVRLSCKEHGYIETRENNIELVKFVDPDVELTNSGNEFHDNYRLKCPKGNEIILEIIDRLTANLLESAGCEITYIDLPVIESGNGLPVDHDSLIDFHNALNNIDDRLVEHLYDD